MKKFLILLTTLIVLVSCGTSRTYGSTATRGDICDIEVFQSNGVVYYNNVVYLERDEGYVYFCDREGRNYYRADRYSVVIKVVGYSYSYPYYRNPYRYHRPYYGWYRYRQTPPPPRHRIGPNHPAPKPGHGPAVRPNNQPRKPQQPSARPNNAPRNGNSPAVRPNSRPSQPHNSGNNSRPANNSSRSSSSNGRRR